MKYYNMIIFGLLFFVLLLFPIIPSKASTLEVKLDNYSITMEFVKDDEELLSEEWPKEDIKITTVTKVVVKNNRIVNLLKDNGIHSDNESYALLYNLNPELKRIDPLPLGSTIKIPKVIGGTLFEQKLKKGYIVLLTVDKQFKDELNKDVEAINSLSKPFLPHFKITEQCLGILEAKSVPKDVIEKLKNLQDKEFEVQHDFLVALTRTLNNQKQTEEFQSLILKQSRFIRLRIDRFENDEIKEDLVSNIEDLADWFTHIKRTTEQRTGPPLHQETLFSLHNEAELLKSLLDQMLKSEKKLNVTDSAQISSIHEDLKVEISKYDQVMAGALPDSEPVFEVIVEIKGNDLQKINNLRVYYVANGLYREPLVNPPVDTLGFPGLGSGSVKELPIKNYQIWAAQDGDPLHPVTPPYLLELRKELKVPLVLKVKD